MCSTDVNLFLNMFCIMQTQSYQIHSMIKENQQQKNATRVPLRLSSNMIGSNKKDFWHKLLHLKF